MSDVAAAFRDHLEADGAVAAIVGTKIRRGRARESDEKEAHIVIVQTPGASFHHQGGATDLALARVEVNCYAPSRGVANLISEAVREALDGRPKGALGDDSLVVDSVVQDGPPIQLDFAPKDGSELGEFRDQLTYDAYYRQSVPTFA